MDQSLSFIETQFPVSKMSKESYKERKANNGQTLTGLGKWWGRKPLILVRAAILGCLMPASDNPQKDTEIFLKLLSMDERGLESRKEKKFSAAELYGHVCANKKLAKYRTYFDLTGTKPKLNRDAPKNEIELAVFRTLGYDEKIAMCKRPEHVEITDQQTWNEINHHLGTSANSLQELVSQLSMCKYGHNVMVGDCFCGGGSIPFEAARTGLKVYASDLNPIATLLTWSSLNICNSSLEESQKLNIFLKKVFNAVDDELTQLGVEENEHGERAIAYLYCNETKCPECGNAVPLAPSWVIGKKTKSIVYLELDNGKVNFKVTMNASTEMMKQASKGTVVGNDMICPFCGKKTPITAIRHDYVNDDGKTVYGLRKWEKNEFSPRETDTFTERLYAIKYLKTDGSWYYREPHQKDLENEKIVENILRDNYSSWQKDGLVSDVAIEPGYNTDQIYRERGWGYWNQLFNPRQQLMLVLFQKNIEKYASTKMEVVLGLLGYNRILNWNSKLCQWSSYPTQECGLQTFYNQALNTFYNYSTRALKALEATWNFSINQFRLPSDSIVKLKDARDINQVCDLWITDPPYADAVNYHELSEMFLSWDRRLLSRAFEDWYADSKRVLAVKGNEAFSETMISIYKNLAHNMSENGMQIVMFTHSDPSVWAQLAIIMWKSGLKVTAAWNVATESDVGGIHSGNYVKGTVLLVLRKQTGEDFAFLDEINADIRTEVKNQIVSMQVLDDKEEPNFSDPDYVLAAYAASLKVLTSYATIEDLDLDYELNQAISNPSRSKIVSIIENAKKIAFDCVIPIEFSSFLWRDLTSAEKFYIKGLESEKRGNYQISTYQEFARGFSIGGYSQLMANERANTARLKTPFEMAGRNMGDVPDFESSIMRTVFQGIYVGIKEEMNPQKALGFIKNELSNYWDKREMIGNILSFLVDIKDISNMQPHWTESAEMAELLLAAVMHDGV